MTQEEKKLQDLEKILCVRDLRSASRPYIKMLETVASELKELARTAGQHQEVVAVISAFVYTCSVIFNGALEDIEQEEAAKIQ